MFKRRSLLAAGMASTIITKAKAQASTWPDRPIRMIIGYPAGGPTDFPGRLLQEPLQRLWGQPIVIENRPGASQVIASEMVARSAPDGYTIFLAASTHASNAAVYARLPYDTINDFTPIVNIYASPTVLFTGAGQPFRTAQELVAAARRDPGMAFASSGNGASGHFALEMFRKKMNLDLTHVAYRGAAPALQDVVAGRVPGLSARYPGRLAWRARASSARSRLARRSACRRCPMCRPWMSSAWAFQTPAPGTALSRPVVFRAISWIASHAMCRAYCAIPRSASDCSIRVA